MRSTEIDGLTLDDDGGFSLGGTPVPAGAEFPAVQLGEWTLSKALGEGKPLTASRGDGHCLVFEFKNGRWHETATYKVRSSPRNRQRAQGQGDVTALLEKLANVPLHVFHWSSIVDAEPSIDAEPDIYHRRNSPVIRTEHTEGEISLHNDGAVILGSEYFPARVGIDGFRFGGSIAYRERGGSMLVVASPGSIRFYYASCQDEEEGPYDSLGVPGFLVGRYEWRECQGPFGALKRFLLYANGVELRDGKFSALVASGEKQLYGRSCPSLVYLSSDRTVYVRIWEREIKNFASINSSLQLKHIMEPERENKHPKGYHIPEPFMEIPPGKSFSYRSPRLRIESWKDHVLINYDADDIRNYFDETRSDSCGSEPASYHITRGDHACKFATWGCPYSYGDWTWFKLTPRQGMVKLPQFGGSSTSWFGR